MKTNESLENLSSVTTPPDLTKKNISSISQLTKTQLESNLKVLRDKDREMVRGKFIYHEVPGGNISFNFRKYKQDPLEKFELNDGEVYTLPLGVAKHLNTNCWYPTYNYKNDDLGRPQMSVGEKIRRCSFQSLEFLDMK